MILVSPLMGGFATDSAKTATEASIAALTVGGLFAGFGWYNIHMARKGYSRGKIYRRDLQITGSIWAASWLIGFIGKEAGLDLSHVNIGYDHDAIQVAFNIPF